jgi:hypothetical protein
MNVFLRMETKLLWIYVFVHFSLLVVDSVIPWSKEKVRGCRLHVVKMNCRVFSMQLEPVLDASTLSSSEATRASVIALPHENLSFSSSSVYVPTTLLLSVLRDLDLARLLWSKSSIWVEQTERPL